MADVKLERLETETINEKTVDLDRLSTEQLLRVLHDENHTVAAAVDSALPAVIRLVEELTVRMKKGGRIVYVGAGTSGRLGVLDASECPPTFGVEPGLVVGLIAGGDTALRSSIEGAEDSESEGGNALHAVKLTANDTVIGIAASGRTPFVIGAVKFAKQKGALTAAVVNVSESSLAEHVDIVIAAVTGPEPITGSTRLKAGTAQKMILNLITNGAMVNLGKVYGNLMVDLRATNEKLKDRASRIVMKVTGIDREEADELLIEAGFDTKTAIVMKTNSLDRDAANMLLEKHGGQLRKCLEVADRA